MQQTASVPCSSKPHPLSGKRWLYILTVLLTAVLAAAQVYGRMTGAPVPGEMYSGLARWSALFLLALPILPVLAGMAGLPGRWCRGWRQPAPAGRWWLRPLLFAVPLALSAIPRLEMGPNQNRPMAWKAAALALLAELFFLLFAGWQRRLQAPSGLWEAGGEADARRMAAGGPSTPASGRLAGFWPAFFTALAGMVLNWIFVFPSGSNMDTVNQWEQIHGHLRRSDIHAPVHTLYLKALLQIWDSYGTVILFQILAFAVLFGCFSRFLARKGVPVPVTCLLIAAHLLCMTVSQTYFFPFKDVPYTLCIGIVTLLLLELLEQPVPVPASPSGGTGGSVSPGRTPARAAQGFGAGQEEDSAPEEGSRGGRRPLFSLPRAVLLGACLALITLFRYNGIVVTLGCGLWFAWRFAKGRQWRQLLAMAGAALVCAVGLQLYVRQALRPDSLPNGFSIQVFGSGVAAVVAYGGEISPEQWERIQAVLPVQWMKEKYTSWTHPGLIWDWDNDPRLYDPNMRVFNNSFVLSMGMHKWEVVRLYFSLLPRNLGLMLRDVLYNTSSVHGIFTDNFPSCNVFLTGLIAFAAAVRWRRRQWRTYWVIVLPILCNMLSIAISTITNEFRYLLPTASLFPFLLLYILSVKQPEELPGQADS